MSTEFNALRLLRVPEAATRLGLTPKALYNLLEDGGGPPAVRIGRRVRFDLRDLDEWIQTHKGS